MSTAAAPAPRAPVLELRAASAAVRGRVIVRSVSLRLHAGETLAVVGPSGAGKSTLARMAAGMIPLTAGTVWLAGTRLDGDSPTGARRAAQMIFQDPRRSLDPRLRVAAAITEGLEIAGDGVPRWGRGRRAWRRQRAEAWLRRVGLEPELATRFPAALSGGQLQRVALARAMAVSPRLLIADEPVAALDNLAGVHMLELLAQLQRDSGVACLLISHHLAQASRFAPRLAVMQAGEIVETGPTAEVLARPQHDCTRRLLAALPPWPLPEA